MSYLFCVGVCVFLGKANVMGFGFILEYGIERYVVLVISSSLRIE